MEQPSAGGLNTLSKPAITVQTSLSAADLQPQPRLTCQEGAGGDFQVTNRPEEIINHLHLLLTEKKYCLSYELFTR